MTMLSIVKLELSNECLSIDKKIKLVFYITELSVKNKIGVKFMGNIWSGFVKRLNALRSNELLFELMDDPIVNYTEVLFMGEGFPNYKERMNNIQNFFKEIFNLNYVKKITLDIDACSTEEETKAFGVPEIYLKPENFIEKMFDLHEKHNHGTPLVRMVFEK